MPSVAIHLCRLCTKTLFKSQDAKTAHVLSRVYLPWLSRKPFLDQGSHPRPILDSMGRKPQSELCLHITYLIVLIEMSVACTADVGPVFTAFKPFLPLFSQPFAPAVLFAKNVSGWSLLSTGFSWNVTSSKCFPWPPDTSISFCY